MIQNLSVSKDILFHLAPINNWHGNQSTTDGEPGQVLYQSISISLYTAISMLLCSCWYHQTLHPEFWLSQHARVSHLTDARKNLGDDVQKKGKSLKSHTFTSLRIRGWAGCSCLNTKLYFCLTIHQRAYLLYLIMHIFTHFLGTWISVLRRFSAQHENTLQSCH